MATVPGLDDHDRLMLVAETVVAIMSEGGDVVVVAFASVE